MDRNVIGSPKKASVIVSLSVRRAWIEISDVNDKFGGLMVALRKESVDRNFCGRRNRKLILVALRKESVDRNSDGVVSGSADYGRSP